MEIGTGMLRRCLNKECQLLLGCYQPDGKKCDCGDNCQEICPDTQETSHGLCDACLELALNFNRGLRMQPKTG